jgi:hypothetical protein
VALAEVLQRVDVRRAAVTLAARAVRARLQAVVSTKWTTIFRSDLRIHSFCCV